MVRETSKPALAGIRPTMSVSSASVLAGCSDGTGIDIKVAVLAWGAEYIDDE